MIEKQSLTTHALKLQTSFGNVLREYCQQLFLTNFYQQNGSQEFLFKGGTALRLAFGSPRFSEDLDFSATKNSRLYEKILEEVLLALSFENINTDLVESKPTTGGHLAIVKLGLFGQAVEIRNEISFRSLKPLVKEATIVTSSIIPSYKIYLLDRKALVKGKIQALISRQKPRDFFDLYFILRSDELRRTAKLGSDQRKKIILSLEKQKKEAIYKELKRLLPKSFWPVIKDLPQALKKELKRR